NCVLYSAFNVHEKWAYFMPELVVRPQKIKVFGRPEGGYRPTDCRLFMNGCDSPAFSSVETAQQSLQP
ncbi:hypothetical protein ACTQ1O_13890, partial [Bilifractor sp. LCP21S3_A7]|uniref:hypothetical protein n=1 Tax=Bilifractor sp. LCP21S3_A7 TaxID=3438738 RepID=UPI003F934754